jgi:3-oxoacyl-[acyl-carrier-protein] synthase-3
VSQRQLPKRCHSRASGFARIAATATVLPDNRVNNQDLVAEYGHRVSPAVMQNLVGVRERRVAPHGTADSDLLAQAAERCLAQASVHVDELHKLFVTKFIGDRVLPMTASLLQHKLGAASAFQAFDIDGGINSFIHALDAASCSIATGDGPILIASGGVINRVISRTDPRVAFQFGDGTAAVLLVPAQQRHIHATYTFTNSEYSRLARGFSVRTTIPQDIHETKDYARLFDLYEQNDWKPAWDFVLTALDYTVQQLLDAAGKRREQVDLFLVTETQHRLWQAVLDRLGIEPRRTLSILSDRGNTMSAMLPMQLDEAIRAGVVGSGSLVMLLSIGEGLSGGGALLTL